LTHPEPRPLDGERGISQHPPVSAGRIAPASAGTVTYDDYGGAWGDIDQLNALGQEYKLQTTCEWAENEGYFVERQKQANGHVNLLITGYK